MRRVVPIEWVIAAAALGALVACRPPPEAPPQLPLVRIATGLPGAGFLPIGMAIVDGLSKRLPRITFEAVESPGSSLNLQYLQSGRIDVALAYADGAYSNFRRELGGHADHDAVRAIALLHPSAVHVLVRADASVNSIAELHGRRIAAGPAGTGTAFTSETVLRFFGVRLRPDMQVPLNFDASARALEQAEVDAFFVVSAVPVDSVRRATGVGARLLAITGPHVDTLLTEYPFLRRAVIPAGTYPHQHVAVPTVTVDTLLVCRRSLDDALIKSVTEAFFDMVPDLAARFDALRHIDLERAPAVPIPLHPGAALFYRESELRR